jgi:uncharacterized protein YecE (DUF72 family)
VHQAITHRYMLEPVEEMFEMVNQMRQICKVLRAEVLHLQFPPSFKPTKSSNNDLQAFLSSVDFRNPSICSRISVGIPGSARIHQDNAGP